MHIEKIKKQQNMIYIVLWGLVVTIYSLHLFVEKSTFGLPPNPSPDILKKLVTIGIPVITFLLNNYILIPRLVEQNRIWIYIATALTTVVGFGWLENEILHTFHLMGHPAHGNINELHGHFQEISSNIPLKHNHHPFGSHNIFAPPNMVSFLLLLIVIGVNLGIWALTRGVAYRIERSELIAANIESQLNQLKTQINPHFYMNMLNSIHGLVDLNPPKAKDLIMDMSRLMRYMLYDSASDKVSLTKEIDFLRDYIKMISERYPKGKVEVATHFPPTGMTDDIMVPPLLYIIFVENAFKHGVDYRYESRIEVTIEIIENKIIFVCHNLKHPEKDRNREKGGLGLTNIRRRLLLLYNEKADLKIKNSNNDYTITLTIPKDET